MAEEQETRLTQLQQAFGGYSSQDYAAQDWATLSGFADSGAVSAWAEEALSWACASGLLEGDGGSLRPGATCTRAEASVILERFAALLTA